MTKHNPSHRSPITTPMPSIPEPASSKHHRSFLFPRAFGYLRSLALALALGAAGGALALPVSDSWVIDPDAGTNKRGALFRVEVDAVQAQKRKLVSDFGAGINKGQNPHALAVESDGRILVVDALFGGGTGALFRVNPATGARTVVSDLGNPAQGPITYFPVGGIALEAGGKILLADLNSGADSHGALYRIDPATGTRTRLSDFGYRGQGPLGFYPRGIALETSGNILVATELSGTNDQGALFRVNPTTGVRTLLSDFGIGLYQGQSPQDVAVEKSGTILVTDPGMPGGALFRIDPASGARTLLSDFSDASQGVTGYSPYALALEASGNILVTGFGGNNAKTRILFRVDRLTGQRKVVQNFSLGLTAPIIQNPLDIALVYSCLGRPATILGTSGNDILKGTSGTDVIMGLGGDDVIYGGASGDDVLCGGDGRDTLTTSTVFGALDNDTRQFATLQLGPRATILDGGSGNDKLTGYLGNDLLGGGPGSDTLDGGGGDDMLSGDGGNDYLDGGPGINELDGGRGTDTCLNGPDFNACELF